MTWIFVTRCTLPHFLKFDRTILSSIRVTSSNTKPLTAKVCSKWIWRIPKVRNVVARVLRVCCQCCHHERLVAFSCKRRGFCPSCCGKRMTENAALLVDTVLPHQPMRQWVLSVPFPLRLLFASQPQVMGKALKIVYRVIAAFLIRKSGYNHKSARTGAVTLISVWWGAGWGDEWTSGILDQLPDFGRPAKRPEGVCPANIACDSEWRTKRRTAWESSGIFIACGCCR